MYRPLVANSTPSLNHRIAGKGYLWKRKVWRANRDEWWIPSTTSVDENDDVDADGVDNDFSDDVDNDTGDIDNDAADNFDAGDVDDDNVGYDVDAGDVDNNVVDDATDVGDDVGDADDVDVFFFVFFLNFF